MKAGRLNDNNYITEADIPDPTNIPIPLGWTLKVRPYKVEEQTRGGIILATDDINSMNTTVNVGRVISIGPCCWNRPHHFNKDGERFDWVKIGDFISYPRHVGTQRKFKGVSIITLADDQIDEKLPDPLIFGEENAFTIDIPKDHLEKYNTIYNPNYSENEE